MSRRGMRAGTMAAALFAALRAAAQPGEVAPDAQVKSIMQEAIGRGSRVILKRIDYVGPGGNAPAPGAGEEPGAVRSKTYIEIDTRPSAGGDEELLGSQKQVEESQRKMMESLEQIGRGQERHGAVLEKVESRGEEIAAGAKRAAEDRQAAEEEAAVVGGAVDEAHRTVGDSDRLLGEIRDRARELSGTVDQLSTRVDEAARGGAERADPAAGARQEFAPSESARPARVAGGGGGEER